VNLTKEQGQAWVAVLSGAVAYIAANPGRWWLFVFLPRIIRGLWATAASESNFNPSAQGDQGTSVGILQFQRRTWERLGGGDITDPREQGAAAIAYILEAGPSWGGRLLSPFGRPLLAWRTLWVGGRSYAYPPDSETIERLTGENTLGRRAWSAPPWQWFGAWLLVGGIPGVLTAALASAGVLVAVRRSR
jgi:hypothetical protein